MNMRRKNEDRGKKIWGIWIIAGVEERNEFDTEYINECKKRR